QFATTLPVTVKLEVAVAARASRESDATIRRAAVSAPRAQARYAERMVCTSWLPLEPARPAYETARDSVNFRLSKITEDNVRITRAKSRAGGASRYLRTCNFQMPRFCKIVLEPKSPLAQDPARRSFVERD